ncbi:uncharacterized protein EV422DRAFT_272286 [Fimicolochytrium jonesii]|uniref:uncharacterized protein n=1 Tax=Fimicolochytrium jonesii TaxID=1396493 RepID=UPI0022FDD217|nr:uncharacterized protein EV422DRAFT_272286 [Fimicolochytrium jonesii]KAI8816857.1 hypothetical protein EV422DRAFT_272286 [Fimicolochytrium jonesii]
MDPQTFYNRLHKRPSHPVMGSNPNPNPIYSSTHTGHSSVPSAAASSSTDLPPSSLRPESSLPPSRHHPARERSESSVSVLSPSLVRNLHNAPMTRPGFRNEMARQQMLGPPSRSHWKPDQHSMGCDACGQRFTFLFRRHHCRRCGGVFCLRCSSHSIRLDQDCQYHPSGALSRVCTTCYNILQRAPPKAAPAPFGPAPPRPHHHPPPPPHSHLSDTENIPGRVVPSVAAKAVPIGTGVEKGRENDKTGMSLMSVPSDWQWSTF